jgi:hypothetical protein
LLYVCNLSSKSLLYSDIQYLRNLKPHKTMANNYIGLTEKVNTVHIFLG